MKRPKLMNSEMKREMLTEKNSKNNHQELVQMANKIDS